MSTDVTVQTSIRAPRGRVAAYATDYRNDPAWIGAIREARLVTEPPFGVGARVERTGSFLGKPLQYVNEVVELVPDERLVMKSVKAPFPMTVTYEFEEQDEGTSVMRIRTTGDASGMYKLAGPLLNQAVKRGITGDLKRLKEQMEADGPDA
jgi:uncharacterized membrane protein